MPDMAHSLHPLVDCQEVILERRQFGRILNLVRIDIEQAEGCESINKQSFDWVDMLDFSDHIWLKLMKKLQKLPFLKHKIANNWLVQSRHLYFKACNYFLAHDTVYTDRLHGLILAVLLGREVKLKDNSYGKNSGYHAMWLAENPQINLLKK
ncbi:MAG: polysaccharide pyruvyl transferase, partial [Shewanella sp.]|nr:polysaccharide pyruvyl transferase [Shewanella sp.]